MPATPIVLVHGYSDKGASFLPWKAALTERFKAAGEVPPIHICNYVTLNNEVTIKDLAEGFDRTLRRCAGLDAGQEFDAIVHSTGMLVVRSWLATYAERRDRLKHLVGLAPATFGSPLAAQGRSWLGAIFKGNKDPGPDFLNAGNQVLDGLELGSRLTWDLANTDLVGEEPVYGRGTDTPYVFIFVGNTPYDGLRGLVNQPGTDGTVRWAGVAMNSRKINLDLRRRPDAKRLDAGNWQQLAMPMYAVEGRNHGTILSDPKPELVDLVYRGLNVSGAEEFDAWSAAAADQCKQAAEKMTKWQQFIVRAVDDRGDPITDYNLELVYKNNGLLNFMHRANELELDVHAYSADKSLRCFHINLDDLQKIVSLDESDVKVRVIASSGSALVTYSSGLINDPGQDAARKLDDQGNLDVEIDLSPLLGGDLKLFFPFTTTLIELHLTREPTPLDYAKPCSIFELLEETGVPAPQ